MPSATASFLKKKKKNHFPFSQRVNYISTLVSHFQNIVKFPYLPISYFPNCIIYTKICHISILAILPISYFHTCVIFPTNSHISILVSRFQKSVIFPYTDIMFPCLRHIITLPIFFSSYFHTCVQTVPPYTCRPGK